MVQYRQTASNTLQILQPSPHSAGAAHAPPSEGLGAAGSIAPALEMRPLWGLGHSGAGNAQRSVVGNQGAMRRNSGYETAVVDPIVGWSLTYMTCTWDC